MPAATGNSILDKGYVAAAALTKFRAVKMSAAGTVTPVTSNSDLIVGFALFSVSTAEIARGKGASIREMGICEAEATGAIAINTQVQLESDGRVSQAVGSSGKRIVGRCVGAPSTNAGDRISLLIDNNGGVA